MAYTHHRGLAAIWLGYLIATWALVGAKTPNSNTDYGTRISCPDEELWRTHERRRERLVAFARSRLRSQLEARGATPSEIAQADEILNPEALTIGSHGGSLHTNARLFFFEILSGSSIF